jgi:hypothetical protein
MVLRSPILQYRGMAGWYVPRHRQTRHVRLAGGVADVLD